MTELEPELEAEPKLEPEAEGTIKKVPYLTIFQKSHNENY